MRNQVSAFLVTAFMASVSFAQGMSTTISENTWGGTEGFRISVVKPVLDMTLTARDQMRIGTLKGHVENSYGVSVGYANLPVQSLGWTVNAALINMSGKERTNSLMRADANLGHAFTNIFNIKGGLNISKFASGELQDQFEAAIGFQGSVGVQLTKNIGMDVGYVTMNQVGSNNGLSFDLEESGIELGLNGTF